MKQHHYWQSRAAQLKALATQSLSQSSVECLFDWNHTRDNS